jgi:pyrroline-5-carboxylate reductase
MGFAILSQACEKKTLDPADVSVYEIDPGRAHTAAATGVKVIKDLTDLSGYEVTLLAVKPKDIGTVLNLSGASLPRDSLIISVAAGVSLQSLQASFSSPRALVRVMPNINALAGAGMSALSYNSHVTEKQKGFTRALFSAVGEILEVEEQKLDAVTGLSGSGPAYAAIFLSALIEGGVRMGLTREESGFLALHTVAGTMETLRKRKIDPEKLREMVSSPGGTTVEAVHVLENRKFRDIVIEAVEAAAKKSIKLREKK